MPLGVKAKVETASSLLTPFCFIDSRPIPFGGSRNDVDAVRVVMEQRQSELDPLRFHTAAAALRRGVDRVGPCRPCARRAAPEAGRIRRLPRPCRAKGTRLHTGA